MNKRIKLVSLVLLLTLNCSCVEKKSTEKEVKNAELVATSKADTLKFTSGIRAIFQDSKGNYWFGSLQEGVAVYNGQSFTYITVNEGITDNQIHSIQEDKEGVIWFNTQTGVSSYDGTIITNHTKSSKQNSRNVFQIQTDDAKKSQWLKADRDLWFEAGNKSGVYRYDGQQLHYLDFPPQKVLNPNDNLFAVTDIAVGKNNMIWFATYAGVFGYNGRDFTIINDETLGYDRKIEPLHIRSIFEDSKGRLWIGNNGIGVLLKEGDSIINFSNKHGLIPANSKRNGDKSPQGTLEHVFAIAEDKSGNIWFGDRDTGIWKYDGVNMINYTKKNGLSNEFTLAIFEDKKGKLWFGMADGSLYTFNGKAFDKQF
ncbi:Two component regulator propeller [Flexibacter flexilis DSM 6793]|uniref:Two component regulator propeller n=1 Tax=Flexibacter flexilis DSM 6793 TaxID=927664 RepID=A0A1I1I7I2_9BACT|nr:two-component regulator propeller domain-containing protein [Flexibacter flexilis]SFC30188.1 Two component regulator propeller [Flexibacter flexilis DSM 6793]